MPVQLYSAPMKYKDQNGDYQSIIGISGNPGRGIASVVLNNDYTLTINFTDNTSTTTSSIRGNGIASIEKTSTAGVVDTYTITDSDGGTSTFTVENGVTPSLSIGTVVEGQAAAATITGTADAPVLNLVLPAANLNTKADKADTVFDTTLSRGRKANTTVGAASLAFGVDAEASGYYSVALGLNTTAASQGAFAEGKGTTAHYIAHAEGENTEANGQWSHSEGVDTIANGAASHAGGDNTIANGHSSFVTGRYNVADSYDNWPFWAANTSYSVGDKVKREQLVNNEATIVGYICKEANTDESFDISHWNFDVHHMNFAAIVGNGYEAEDPTTHEMVRHGSNAYALDWEGNGYFAGDVYVGADAGSANGTKLVKETDVPIERGTGEGSAKMKNFFSSILLSNTASGAGSFAEGGNNTASGLMSHAEGFLTTASGASAHAEGFNTNATAVGAHTEGGQTIASSSYQHVQGKYNISDDQDIYTDIVGNGTANNARSNAYALTWTGDGHYAGDVYVGCNADSTGGTKLAKITDIPVTDVQVNGTSILSSGVANVPVASSSNFGVVKTNESYGIGINTNGQLKTIVASTAEEKAGTNAWKPIAPIYQHASAFYGLAKAAGDSTQSSSSNAVGTYTDSAKEKIQHMLGVDTIIAPNETNPVTNAHVAGDLFTLNGKLYQATATIASGESLVVGTNCAVVNASEVFPHDVQVNGSSVVSGGVANVPKASSSVLGAVKISNNGISIDSNGSIYLGYANDASIKAGNSTYGAITTTNQHTSVFYGLAKAAGDSTQSASANAVGTYTTEAKAAIQSMLGITQTLTVTVNTQDNVTVTGQTVYVREDDENGPIYTQAVYEGQPVSFAVPSGFHYYVSVSDTLAHHFNPTTATGIITNTNISVTLQYSDFSSIQSAADIKAALNADLDLTDLVGETITCTKGTDTLTWDVVDYDSTNKTITLLLHDAFGSANMVFEPAQALMWCENGLTAGNYTFKWNTTQCYFTLTQAIPAGGQLRATNSAFSTYESQSATATIETGTVSTTEITGATDLGTTAQGLLNHHDRVNYGSNNYAESALYWWLNSDAAANTPRTPVTKFSRAYSYNVAGFMNGLDASFVSCLDNTVWKCSTNNVYECPSSLGGITPGKQNSYTVTAKFGLASEMEIFGSYGGTADGSVIFDLYNNASADDRKKYRSTTAQTWWLRSPGWGHASFERYVGSSGGASHSGADGSCAVVPACRISKDV